MCSRAPVFIAGEASHRADAGSGGSRKSEADAELIAWARRRGYVSFLFFFLIAVAVRAIWFLTR
jgi:hypothetical protein